MKSGIYMIESPSGARYIGSAVNLANRQSGHFSKLRKGIHKNSRLQRGWNACGGNLSFKTLLICRREDLIFYEQIAINAYEPGYNQCPVAGNSLGLKWSPESRARKSLQHIGRKDSVETKAKKSAALTGRIVSPETKKRIAAQAGWKHSQESKNKMRGRVRSAEHRRKLSESLKGRPGPWQGRRMSEETKRKISEKLRGRRLSAETCAKMSASWYQRGCIRESLTPR